MKRHDTRRSKVHLCLGLLCGCLCLGGSKIQAQFSVSGVSDKSTYTDRVAFTVNTVSGFDVAAWLDSSPVPVGSRAEVAEVDYHELALWATNRASLVVTNTLLRFIVVSGERGSTETGLPAWTPFPPIPSSAAEMAGARIRLLAPAAYPVGMPIPLAAWIENETGGAVRVNGTLESDAQPGIRILRGVGSGFLAPADAPGQITYQARLKGSSATKLIQAEEASWVAVQPGTLGTTTWPENSRISILGNLTIPAGAVVKIGAGTVVSLAGGSTLTLNGEMVINGAAEAPVVFAPAAADKPWGGFNLAASTSRLAATATIFTGSGADPNGVPDSHRHEQALFFMDNHSAVALTNCAVISLAGQFGHGVDRGSPLNSLAIVGTLIQRCTTGGEWNGCAIQFLQSAIVEVPALTPVFNDGDEDGFYFNTGRYEVRDSLIGWTRDDGIDAGGGGAGSVTVSNTWVESVFHECFAWSGDGRRSTNLHTVVLNSGQGIECGYSTSADSPNDFVEDSLSLGNATGIRFGDNYDWTYNGFIRVTNSISVFNHRDTWGMNWSDWTYRTSQMDIRGNFLSQANPHHPTNTLWRPEADGWRLASFMTTPPSAPVGVGLALWATQFDLAAVTNAVPVGLSSFTTNTVSVDYALEAADRVLAQGTLCFAPGETVKKIQPQVPSIPNLRPARLILSNPTNAELTGIATAWYLGQAQVSNVVLVPAGSVWSYLDTGTNAGTAWRATGFDDTSWKSGPAELGYGDGPEATKLSYGTNSSNKYITYYFRQAFEVPDPARYTSLVVRLKRDDGGIVYLNDRELFRSNMPNTPVDYLTRASANASDDGSTFVSTNTPASSLAGGRNVLAVEIHQESPSSSDISFDLQLEASLPPKLNTLAFGDDWYLTWIDSQAQLETAGNPGGPWSALSSTSPALIERSAARQFFRLRLR